VHAASSILTSHYESAEFSHFKHKTQSKVRLRFVYLTSQNESNDQTVTYT